MKAKFKQNIKTCRNDEKIKCYDLNSSKKHHRKNILSVISLLTFFPQIDD